MFDALVALLSGNPLLLLFVITGIGHLAGRLRFGSFSLGASGILFVGLAFGALHPEFRLPSIVYEFGLVLFVYMLGLSAGPCFFSSFRRRGVRATAIGTGRLAPALGIALIVSRSWAYRDRWRQEVRGALTSTPALAAPGVHLRPRFGQGSSVRLAVGYSLSYPSVCSA